MHDDTIYLTKQGLEDIKKELEELKKRRMEIAAKIAEAQTLGDLSENAEYQSARMEQSINEGRIMELEHILKHAVIIEEENQSSGRGDGVVSVGSKIKIKEHTDDGVIEKVYHIVGSHEADPSQGKISNESPIGKALLGSKVGDIVEIQLPKGTIKCEIVDIL